MQMEEFVGQVQTKARLANLDEALRATRATLETLAERIGTQEARHLGAQLPSEIQRYLDYRPAAETGDRYSSVEFIERVGQREGTEPQIAAHHARAVLEVLQQAVSLGEMRDVLDRLPEDYRRLFAGSAGQMPRA